MVAVYTAADLKLEPQAARQRAGGDAAPGLRLATSCASSASSSPSWSPTRARRAVDAAELVEVDYDPLDVLIDPERALDDDAPVLFPDAENGNLAVEGRVGERGRRARRRRGVVGGRFVNQRLAAVPMEPSAGIAAPDPERPGAFVLWTPSQNAHAHRDSVAAVARARAGATCA